MNGLVFEERRPVVRSAPNRADIACFVGLVKRRPGPVPSPVVQALAEQGWTSPPYARPIDALRDVPVPIDAWQTFDRLFAWEQRPLDGRAVGASYLGAAVRSFFAQGGRKCYVIRVDDPAPLTAPRRERLLKIGALLPGYPARFDPTPADRDGWHGLGHLFGLPDVSFVCLPDLADLVAAERAAIERPPAPPPPPEQFVECSDPPRAPERDRVARLFEAPRADEAGYAAWARAIRLAADAVARFQREVQLVAGVPMPEVDSAADHDLAGFLHESGWLTGRRDLDLTSLASAFVQLVYPWVLTPGSTDLPEQAEPADGVFAGVLARNALTRGAFRSAAGLPLGDVLDLVPALSSEQLTGQSALDGVWTRLAEAAARRLPADIVTSLLLPCRLIAVQAAQVRIAAPDELVRDALMQHHVAALAAAAAEVLGGRPRVVITVAESRPSGLSLVERVSVMGPTPGGLRVLSDVTTAADEIYRLAAVNRLVSVIVRAARRLGEDSAFEPSSEQTWADLRGRLSELLRALFQAGALQGATAAEAFSVRCDRSTMSQTDIDNGRVMAVVDFQAAAPIERLRVVLALDEGGQVFLVSPAAAAESAA